MKVKVFAILHRIYPSCPWGQGRRVKIAEGNSLALALSAALEYRLALERAGKKVEFFLITDDHEKELCRRYPSDI